MKKVVYIAKYTLPTDLVEASRSHTNPLYSQCFRFRISCLQPKDPYFIHNHFLALLEKPSKSIKFQSRFCKSQPLKSHSAIEFFSDQNSATTFIIDLNCICLVQIGSNSIGSSVTKTSSHEKKCCFKYRYEGLDSKLLRLNIICLTPW